MGPYHVTGVDEKICIILSYNNITERVTLDRVFLAPPGETEQLPNQTPTHRVIVVTDDATPHPGVTRRSVGAPDLSNDVEEPSEKMPSDNQGEG